MNDQTYTVAKSISPNRIPVMSSFTALYFVSMLSPVVMFIL